jgi:amidase
VTGEHYEGGHWLGSFATYLVTGRGSGMAPALDAAPQPGPLGRAEMLMRSRMARWEPTLNAVIRLDDAAFRRVPAGQGGRGRLTGLPVMVKDNIEVSGMPTTAGSLALIDSDSGRDAFLISRLRAAGLIIAGKTNLSEWANFRDPRSTSGWSAVGGLTRNAWDAARSACGSSSGSAVAVAAAYVPFAVGTETNGSIVCPAAYAGIVGIKPTLGLVSRSGIVPIAHSQDTAGPMAYSVRAAALLLAAMEGEDPDDAATVAAGGYFGRDYLAGLSPQALHGLRVGAIRSRDFGDGSGQAFDRAVADLRAAGAELVDDLAFPDWPEGFWDASESVLLHEFKHGLNRYLRSLPGERGSWTLQTLIEFNEAQREREMPWFGQGLFHQAQQTTGLDSEPYQRAREMVRGFARSAIDALLQEHQLDVLVMPTNALPFSIDLVHGDTWHGGSSSMAAIAGYPHITVPAGRVKGLPVGLSFVGTAFSEPVLIRAAYAYEQATGHATTLAGDDPWGLRQRFSEDAGKQDAAIFGIAGKTPAIPGMIGDGAWCQVAQGEQGEGDACQ